VRWPLFYQEYVAIKRRFEFVGGSSAKFWEVTDAQATVTVCFGKLDTTGQTQTRSFSDAWAAQQHDDELVEQKLGKGYSECQA
jgi:predicted DNA-binding WGR domain protein